MLFSSNRYPEVEVKPEAYPSVFVSQIGRSGAGKTMLTAAVHHTLLQSAFPSRLQLALGDPLTTAQRIARTGNIYEGIQHYPLPSTTVPEMTHFQLFEGETCRAGFSLQDIVGQVLTETTNLSSKDQKQKYAEYVNTLAQTDVLWTVIPCPPTPRSPKDKRRWEIDIATAATYLRTALQLRKDPRPVSLAIVLTKVDLMWATEEEARSKCANGALVKDKGLGQLVKLALASNKVGEAAVFPTTALGWGRAAPAAGCARGDDDTATAGGDRVPGWHPRAERQWTLKGSEKPFNMAALVLYSVLTGLLQHEEDESVDGEEPDLCRILRLLAADLEAQQGWWIPFKGKLLSARK